MSNSVIGIKILRRLGWDLLMRKSGDLLRSWDCFLPFECSLYFCVKMGAAVFAAVPFYFDFFWR